MEVPVPYVIPFVVYYLGGGFIDVLATKENLQEHFVSDYEEDTDFPLFVLDAIENRWNRDQFVEHLQEYNELHEYLKISDALDNDYDLEDAEHFDEYYGEEFCDMYPQVPMEMLRLDGGSDWNDLPAYARFGMEFMEMVRDFMAQIEGIRSAAARARQKQAAAEKRFQADDTRCVRRKIA